MGVQSALSHGLLPTFSVIAALSHGLLDAGDLPTDATMCRVTATIESGENLPAAGIEISFTLSGEPGLRSDRLVSITPILATTDADGVLTNTEGDPWVDLQRNDLLTPANSTWLVTSEGLGLSRFVMRLNAATFNLVNLIP